MLFLCYENNITIYKLRPMAKVKFIFILISNILTSVHN